MPSSPGSAVSGRRQWPPSMTACKRGNRLTVDAHGPHLYPRAKMKIFPASRKIFLWADVGQRITQATPYLSAKRLIFFAESKISAEERWITSSRATEFARLGFEFLVANAVDPLAAASQTAYHRHSGTSRRAGRRGPAGPRPLDAAILNFQHGPPLWPAAPRQLLNQRARKPAG